MIKNLEKDLRIYRHDTFITSFFATITILLIVLIICSLPSHAQEINGGDNNNTWSYDDEDLKSLSEIYKFDVSNVENHGVMCFLDNPNLELYPFKSYNTQDVYSCRNNSDASDYGSAFDFLSEESSYLLPSTFNYNGTTYHLSDYDSFIVYCRDISSSSNISVAVSNGSFYYPKYPDGGSSNYICNDDSNGFIFSFDSNGFIITTPTNDHYTDSDSHVVSTYGYGLGYMCFICSNVSYKGPFYKPNEDNNNTVFDGINFEYNYMMSSFGGSGSSDSETPNNNLVMNDGDWTFKNDHYSAPYDSSFPTGSIYPNGNISFSFNPTEYQIANPSAFELVFTFYMNYDVNYKNWNQKFSVFEQTSQLLNNSKRYSHTYNYNDGGAVEIVVPLSDFISNGNNRSWTWQDVFDKLEDGAFTSVLNNSRELYSVSYNKFDLTASVYLKTASDKSGSITEWYNPMNKKGYTTDDSGSLNKNPFVPSASEDPDSSNSQNSEGNAPGEGGNNGNSGGSTTSNGNVTVYNYNTNNNNNTLNSDGNTFNDIFNTMIGSNKVTSESLADTTGTNGFLSFMNNTIAGVPISFFTSLLSFFTTCLAILIVAFVLRMLLDIL